MLAILVEDLGNQCKVYDGVHVSVLIVADVLELQVAMGISQLVDDFYLRDKLHAHLRNFGEREVLVLRLIFKRLVDFKFFEDVLA